MLASYSGLLFVLMLTHSEFPCFTAEVTTTKAVWGHGDPGDPGPALFGPIVPDMHCEPWPAGMGMPFSAAPRAALPLLAPNCFLMVGAAL